MSILIEPTMDDRIHPGSAVKPSDKEHGVTTDSHWTENYQFSPTMRIRDKTTKPDPAGYATRSWKRDHPEFFMESQARRNAGRPARKRIVKAH